MSTPLLSILISGSLAILLCGLFYWETKRGTRFLESVRQWFDTHVEKSEHFIGVRLQHVSRDVVRALFRFVAHIGLTWLLSSVQKFEAKIASMRHTNRQRAVEISRAKRSNTSKLSQIQAHKEQKRTKRQHTL